MAVSVSDVIEYVRAQLGKPYVFGATGPNTFDCSGLMQYAFHHYGVDLPRTSQEQAKVGQAVDKGNIQPGDLVFSDWGDGPNSHVGIAVGNNQIIDAPHTGATVRYDTLNNTYMAHVTEVRRIIAGNNPLVGAIKNAEGAVSSAADSIVGPLVQPLTDIASAASSGAKLADAIAKVFIPTNFVRLVCFLTGSLFILLGLFFLSREVRS